MLSTLSLLPLESLQTLSEMVYLWECGRARRTWSAQESIGVEGRTGGSLVT